MTWNLYQGVNITPIFTAPPTQIPHMVTKVFRQFLATFFPKRARAIAQQILINQPDVIGLQENGLWELIPPYAGKITFDFAEILLSELRRNGLNYRIAAQNRNFVIGLPSSLGSFIRITDRDTLLIREPSKLKVVHPYQGNYQTNLQFNLAGYPFTVLRGWSAIDLALAGQVFRVVNTHLETLSPSVQVAQAQELLAGPGQTDLPLLLIGDFNSRADGSSTATYAALISAGFKDSWQGVGEGAGFTCCQDADLRNVDSKLDERIDLILLRASPPWQVIKVDRVGEAELDRTKTGLWPSDHAGVVASLQFPQ